MSKIVQKDRYGRIIGDAWPYSDADIYEALYRIENRSTFSFNQEIAIAHELANLALGTYTQDEVTSQLTFTSEYPIVITWWENYQLASEDPSIFVYTPNHKGTPIVNYVTKEFTTMDSYGPYPENWTSILVEEDRIAYSTFDTSNNSWSSTPEDITKLLDDIWDLIVKVRDYHCLDNIDYDGRNYVLRGMALSDLTLAMNAAMASGDIATFTHPWRDADGIAVTLSGTDLGAILTAYGTRRNTMIVESNDTYDALASGTVDAMFTKRNELLQEIQDLNI